MDRKCQQLKRENAHLRTELQPDAATVRAEVLGAVKLHAGEKVQSVSAYGGVVREIRTVADDMEGEPEEEMLIRVMEGLQTGEDCYRELSVCLCKQILLERSLCVPRLT